MAESLYPWLQAIEEGLQHMSKKPLKPGQPAPRSGQYERIGPRGGETGKEITGVKGKTLPPTPGPNQGYKLVDPTKHKQPRRPG
jgi:hypothetical protein